MIIYLLIALGGALGALARFGVVKLSAQLWGTAFPFGTLIVNGAGSLVMGICAAYLLSKNGFDGSKAFLMTGFLGGFTTFSAFSLDVLHQLQKGAVAQAGLYIASSVIISLIAVFVGYWLMRSLLT